MISFLRRSLLPGFVSLYALSACASNDAYLDNQRDLDFALAAFAAKEQPEDVVMRLNRVLADTQDAASEFALQRFYAAFLLAQVHAAASMGSPFREEPTTFRSRVGGIGRRDPSDEDMERPSRTAHLVATMYHASFARSLYEQAARSGPQKDGIVLVPDELWNLGVDHADTNLQILLTTTYSRLGFRDEVAKTLAQSPDLLKPERCLAFLESSHVQTRLKPWVCVMVFEYLKNLDELQAYRFGILAVEGQERFGHALPRSVVGRIDDWIVSGASVKFVCPESQTAYIPGQRRSPISGVPHSEYVAVQR
jgi:hypothetical protein